MSAWRLWWLCGAVVAALALSLAWWPEGIWFAAPALCAWLAPAITWVITRVIARGARPQAGTR